MTSPLVAPLKISECSTTTDIIGTQLNPGSLLGQGDTHPFRNKGKLHTAGRATPTGVSERRI